MKRRLLAAYFTGPAGYGVGCFYVGDGLITGFDLGGIKYDGLVEEKADGSLEGTVEFTVPEGVQLVTGLVGGKDATVSLNFKLSQNFDDGSTITQIDTPTGPLNAKFELVRELP